MDRENHYKNDPWYCPNCGSYNYWVSIGQHKCPPKFLVIGEDDYTPEMEYASELFARDMEDAAEKFAQSYIDECLDEYNVIVMDVETRICKNYLVSTEPQIVYIAEEVEDWVPPEI